MEMRPKAGEEVRHVSTGDVGVYRGTDAPDGFAEWALVEWPRGGPGMVGRDGLARVAPSLLVRQ